MDYPLSLAGCARDGGLCKSENLTRWFGFQPLPNVRRIVDMFCAAGGTAWECGELTRDFYSLRTWCLSLDHDLVMAAFALDKIDHGPSLAS